MNWPRICMTGCCRGSSSASAGRFAPASSFGAPSVFLLRVFFATTFLLLCSVPARMTLSLRASSFNPVARLGNGGRFCYGFLSGRKDRCPPQSWRRGIRRMRDMANCGRANLREGGERPFLLAGVSVPVLYRCGPATSRAVSRLFARTAGTFLALQRRESRSNGRKRTSDRIHSGNGWPGARLDPSGRALRDDFRLERRFLRPGVFAT